MESFDPALKEWRQRIKVELKLKNPFTRTKLKAGHSFRPEEMNVKQSSKRLRPMISIQLSRLETVRLVLPASLFSLGNNARACIRYYWRRVQVLALDHYCPRTLPRTRTAATPLF